MNKTFGAGMMIVAMAIAGCASSRSAFPIVAENLPSDAGMSCSAMDAELSRVQALRHEIGREQGWEGGADAVGVAMSATTSPVAAAVLGLGALARGARYDQAAFAADARIIKLASRRRELQCPQAGSSAEQLLVEQALTLERQYETGDMPDRAYNGARTEIVRRYLRALRSPTPQRVALEEG